MSTAGEVYGGHSSLFVSPLVSKMPRSNILFENISYLAVISQPCEEGEDFEK